jgi:hypothetical protein
MGIDWELDGHTLGTNQEKKIWVKKKVLLGMSQGTHWELEECFENLTGIDWELDGHILGTN